MTALLVIAVVLGYGMPLATAFLSIVVAEAPEQDDEEQG